MGLFEKFFRAGRKGDRPAIEITNINLQKKNSWDNPQIQLWLANPVGFGNRQIDAKLPFEGIVANPPAKGFVRVFIILSKDNSIWPQWDSELDAGGRFKAGLYFATGPGEKYRKTILVQLYETKQGNESSKILEEEYIIE